MTNILIIQVSGSNVRTEQFNVFEGMLLREIDLRNQKS